MSRPNLLLIGAGGHARACIDVVEKQNYYRISGLVGNLDEVRQKRFGYEVIGSDHDLEKLAENHPYALIAVGQIQSAEIRIRIFRRLVTIGFKLPVIVAPSAYVSPHADIGIGTIVMHGAMVNAGAKVGENCIINTRALLEHDVKVGNQCHISTGVILNGCVGVGDNSFIGSGSIIREGVILGNTCFIGMGVLVTSNQSNFTRIVGGGEK
jgi:sugar O-acyltransferase (sialic acid O-acetyltransferase NeuD family)